MTFSASAARDPLEFAVASRDGDVLSMVRRALDTHNAQLAFQPFVFLPDSLDLRIQWLQFLC